MVRRTANSSDRPRAVRYEYHGESQRGEQQDRDKGEEQDPFPTRGDERVALLIRANRCQAHDLVRAHIRFAHRGVRVVDQAGTVGPHFIGVVGIGSCRKAVDVVLQPVQVYDEEILLRVRSVGREVREDSGDPDIAVNARQKDLDYRASM